MDDLTSNGPSPAGDSVESTTLMQLSLMKTAMLESMKRCMEEYFMVMRDDLRKYVSEQLEAIESAKESMAATGGDQIRAPVSRPTRDILMRHRIEDLEDLETLSRFTPAQLVATLQTRGGPFCRVTRANLNQRTRTVCMYVDQIEAADAILHLGEKSFRESFTLKSSTSHWVSQEFIVRVNASNLTKRRTPDLTRGSLSQRLGVEVRDAQWKSGKLLLWFGTADDALNVCRKTNVDIGIQVDGFL